MRLKKNFIPALFFLFLSGTYIHNLSRSVYGGDAGDFITAAVVGGVAHPPGYPLFTLLGFLTTHLHVFPTPAYAVGFISALAGIGSVFIFYFLAQQFSKSTLVSVISASTLAFSYYFWFYSELAEIFILNAFFFLLLFFLALQITQKKKYTLFPLFFFSLGLSLTNHQTIILSFPTLAILFIPLFWQWIQKRTISFRCVLQSILAFVLGCAVYVYVPIASSFHPVINWDVVKDIPSFFHLLLRKDYGTFSAGLYATPTFSQRLTGVKIYLEQITIQLTIPVIFLSVLGALYLLKKNKVLLLSLLVGFVLSGPLFIGYAGFPLTGNFYFGVNERFFILSTVMLLLCVPWGLVCVSLAFEKLLKRDPLFVQSVFVLIPLLLFVYNFPKTNLSQVYLGDTYAEDVMAGISHNAILFLAGDTILFNTWYEHYAVGVRPDIKLLNINGNIGSPYFSVLEKDFKKLYPHASSAAIIQGVIRSLPTDGSVYSVETLGTSADTTWIPYGITFQLVKKNAVPTDATYTHNETVIWNELHVPQPVTGAQALARGNVTIADIPVSYANAMLITGNFYLSQYNDKTKALAWFKKAETVAPAYDKVYSSLGAYYLLTTRQCSLAEADLRQAVFLNPLEALDYFLLYNTYTDCLHNKQKANIIKLQFEKQFQIPFAKAAKTILGKQK